MRVYLPATLPLLRAVLAAGEVGPAPMTGFAVTPALREWYTGGDAEELEYAATVEAARACLRLLAADPDAPRRRVVLAVEVPDAAVRPAPELDRAVVRVTTVLPLAAVAAGLVDDPAADVTVAAAAGSVLAADLGDEDAQFLMDGAEGEELGWYARQELQDLVEG